MFGGAYFRNFTIYDERSFLNRRNTTVRQPAGRREPWERGFRAPLKNMADGIILI